MTLLSSAPSSTTDPAYSEAPTARNARRIRVLQVNYRHTFGGSERLAATIGTSLDPARFESSFAAMKGDGEVGEMLRSRGFHTNVFGRGEGFDPSALWRVWKYLRCSPVDILQTHHVGSLVYCGAPARLLRMKLVHTEHDIHTFRRFPSERGWLKRLRKLPHRFVAIDPIIADFLDGEIGVPRDRIEVIRNGIPLNDFRPRTIPRPHGRPFTVGWIGRLVPPKRPDILLEAIGLLANQGADIQARFIGPGDLLPTLRQRASELGLDDHVAFLGARTDIADQLRDFDCYVLCSDDEGLPISLVEAMATELPCVASAVGGIPSVIKHGKNGWLLDRPDPEMLADLLQAIQDDPSKAIQAGKRAGQLARSDFDLARTIQQYMEVFERVMAER